MADRTLYDVLEVSNTASSDTIAAAYERLVAKFDPESAANAGKPGVRIQLDTVKQAYITLSDSERRAQYDRKLELRNFTPAPVQVLEPFWTLPKMVIAGIVALGIGGFFVKHQKEQSRIEAEKVIAVAKAKEAEAKARADAQAERLALQRERLSRSDEDNARRERDADIQQYKQEARSNDITNRALSVAERRQAQSEASAQDSARRNDESRRKHEEAQAAAAARQTLARDKAELCRMERDRYGRSISC